MLKSVVRHCIPPTPMIAGSNLAQSMLESYQLHEVSRWFSLGSMFLLQQTIRSLGFRFLFYLRLYSTSGSGERQLAIRGNALDHHGLRATPTIDCSRLSISMAEK